MIHSRKTRGSKHVLDLHQMARRKSGNISVPKKAGLFDQKKKLDFDALLSQIPDKKDDTYHFQQRVPEMPETRRERPKVAFNLEPGLMADWRHQLNAWHRAWLRRREKQVNLTQGYSQTQAGLAAKGWLYNLVAAFGWLLAKLAAVLVWLIKTIRLMFFSPIVFLDALLDGIASIVYRIIRFVLRNIFALARFFYRRRSRLDFSMPYYWQKKLGVFLMVAALLIAPVKILLDVPKILEARQEILGVSSRAIGYFGLWQELQEYVPAAQIGKEFAGYNGPRRYLLVFQNNAELRPTGGFMGSYALIDIDAGKVRQLLVPGGGFYDLKGYSTMRLAAPEPYHIFSPYWQIWNANWFADFPSSAKKLIYFYENTGPTVDGVIAITPDLIERLLELVGPIELPEYETTITADNFRRQTQTEVEYEYDRADNKPKAFIGELVDPLLERVYGLLEKDETRKLVEIIDQSLAEKQLLIYSSDEETQGLINTLNWGGQVMPSLQNYLQVVHTNIGGGKTDIAIKDEIRQELLVQPDGAIISEVTLTREHRGDPEDIFEGHDNLDFVRFYVPAGSQFLLADGFTTDDLSRRYKTTDQPLERDPDLAGLENAQRDLASGTLLFSESNKTVFGNWLGLKPGQEKTVKLRYRLPFTLAADTPFHGYWQKQSGTQGTPLVVNISLPVGWRFDNWLPQDGHSILRSDQELTYANDLRVDRVLSFVPVKEN